jgi:hypothetical protein
MQDPEHQPEDALFKSPVGAVTTTVIGSVVAAVSLLVFVFDLLVTPDVGALIVSFVVCGMGLTTGVIVLRRLAPRRPPETIFGGSCGVIVPGAQQPEVPVQRHEHPLEGIRSASPVRSEAEITPVMKSHGSESIATHKTHDGAGFAALVTVVGMTAILVGRIAFAWQFVLLVLLAGGGVALVLYCVRNWQQGLNISRYKAPVTGGVIGAASLAGVGLVMIRFSFLRVFLGLAIGAGCAIALALSWRRRQGSSTLLAP